MIKFVKSDSRNHPRKKLEDKVVGKVSIGPESDLASIIDRSLGGFSLLSKADLLKKARLYQNELYIEYHDQSFKASIKNHRSNKDRFIYGVQLLDFSEEKSLSFTDNQADWDLVENPETIQNIFSDLAFKSASALVQSKQVSGQSILIPERYDKDSHTMLFQFLESSHGKMSMGKSNFSFDLFQTYHSFDAHIVQMDKSKVKVKLPKSIARMLRRETERISPDQFKVGLSIEINSPFLGKAYQGEIYDISEHGLSVLDKDSGALFLPVGYQLTNVQLKLENSEIIEGGIEVRGSKWIEERSCHAIGFRFRPKDSINTTKWHNFILESRYPAMTFNYGDDDHEKIWDLFSKSGHLNINKNTKTYSHILDLTKKTWKKLSDSGTKWSKRAMIRKDGDVLGHIQMDRIYQDTWCIHHLSLDPRVSKLVAKDIYALTTDVLLAEGGEFLVSFTEAEKPWNQRSYYDFVAEYRYKEHNELKHYSTIEVTTDIKQEKRKGIICRIANHYDLKRIKRFIDIYATELERTACCLNNENLKLEKTAEAWKKNGLLRGREFVVAYKDNSLIGLSALEYGESGLNIVGVLNMLYVYNLSFADEDIKMEAVDAMLEEAALFYKSVGREKFLVNLEEGFEAKNLKTKHSFLAHAVRWIAKKDILPRYRSFTHLLYGHIILSKEKIRKKIAQKKKQADDQ